MCLKHCRGVLPSLCDFSVLFLAITTSSACRSDPAPSDAQRSLSSVGIGTVVLAASELAGPSQLPRAACTYPKSLWPEPERYCCFTTARVGQLYLAWLLLIVMSRGMSPTVEVNQSTFLASMTGGVPNAPQRSLTIPNSTGSGSTWTSAAVDAIGPKSPSVSTSRSATWQRRRRSWRPEATSSRRLSQRRQQRRQRRQLLRRRVQPGRSRRPNASESLKGNWPRRTRKQLMPSRLVMRPWQKLPPKRTMTMSSRMPMMVGATQPLATRKCGRLRSTQTSRRTRSSKRRLRSPRVSRKRTSGKSRSRTTLQRTLCFRTAYGRASVRRCSCRKKPKSVLALKKAARQFGTDQGGEPQPANDAG